MPDIVFGPARVAVYVDGCFWHSCPTHATRPIHNAGWWEAKLRRNVERDRATDQALAEAGWLVIRIWEHEDAVSAADKVETEVRARRMSACQASHRGAAPDPPLKCVPGSGDPSRDRKDNPRTG